MSYRTWSGRGGERAWRHVDMWWAAVIALVGVLGMISYGRAAEEPANGQTMSLETFDTYQPHSFPGQWEARGDKETAKSVYSVGEEGGDRFLHAHADKQDVQIGISRVINPKQFPTLEWKWRVNQLPTGANESTKKTNDSAAAVYVVFDNT